MKRDLEEKEINMENFNNLEKFFPITEEKIVFMLSLYLKDELKSRYEQETKGKVDILYELKEGFPLKSEQLDFLSFLLNQAGIKIEESLIGKDNWGNINKLPLEIDLAVLAKNNEITELDDCFASYEALKNDYTISKEKIVLTKSKK